MGIEDWADWKGIRTKMFWTLGSGFVAVVVLAIQSGYGLYWDVYTPDTGLKDQVANHEITTKQAIQDAADDRKQINDKLAKIQASLDKDYYLTGTGSVGTFGGSEKYARVNRRSDAKIYRDGDRVRVTCNNVPGKPETILVVRGTFSDSNSDLLIAFSKEAADDLGITGRVEVDLEPEDK